MKPTIDAVRAALDSVSIAAGTEEELSVAVRALLDKAALSYRAEVRISVKDRLDLVLDGGLVLELKIQGSLADLIRQLDRYAQSCEVEALCVVTTSRRLCRVPSELRGKPVHVVFLGAL